MFKVSLISFNFFKYIKLKIVYFTFDLIKFSDFCTIAAIFFILVVMGATENCDRSGTEVNSLLTGDRIMI